MNFMHACKLLHAHNEKFYGGINYFRGGPNISEIFGPGGPNIMGVQIFRYRLLVALVHQTIQNVVHQP